MKGKYFVVMLACVAVFLLSNVEANAMPEATIGLVREYVDCRMYNNVSNLTEHFKSVLDRFYAGEGGEGEYDPDVYDDYIRGMGKSISEMNSRKPYTQEQAMNEIGRMIDSGKFPANYIFAKGQYKYAAGINAVVTTTYVNLRSQPNANAIKLSVVGGLQSYPLQTTYSNERKYASALIAKKYAGSSDSFRRLIEELEPLAKLNYKDSKALLAEARELLSKVEQTEELKRKISFISVLLFIAIGIFCWEFWYKRYSAEQEEQRIQQEAEARRVEAYWQEETQKQRNGQVFDVEQLAKEFKTDSVKMIEMRTMAGSIILRGRIKSIDAIRFLYDPRVYPLVRFYNAEPVKCLFNFDGEAVLKKLKTGDYVTIKGDIDIWPSLGNDDNNEFQITNCKIVEQEAKDQEKLEQERQAEAQRAEAQIRAEAQRQTYGSDYAKGEEYLNAKDYSPAFEIFKRLANDGYAPAQDKLAWMYQNGWGVEQSYSQAVSWFRKAAEQGNTEAMASMGLMYYRGWGVSRNYDTALEWYGKAAAQGSEVAQRRINSIQLLKTNKAKIASIERGTGFPTSGTIFAETLSVRESPNTKSKRVKTLKTGHPVSISRATESDNDYWFYVKTASGTEGWVLGGYVKLIDRNLSYQELTNRRCSLPESGYVATSNDNLNLRNIPSVKGSEVVEKLDNGEHFTAYEIFAGDTIDWYRIRMRYSGNEGWVSGKYIKLDY